VQQHSSVKKPFIFSCYYYHIKACKPLFVNTFKTGMLDEQHFGLDTQHHDTLRKAAIRWRYNSPLWVRTWSKQIFFICDLIL